MKIIKKLFWASCLFFFTLVVIEVFIGNIKTVVKIKDLYKEKSI